MRVGTVADKFEKLRPTSKRLSIASWLSNISISEDSLVQGLKSLQVLIGYRQSNGTLRPPSSPINTARAENL